MEEINDASKLGISTNAMKNNKLVIFNSEYIPLMEFEKLLDINKKPKTTSSQHYLNRFEFGCKEVVNNSDLFVLNGMFSSST